MAIHVIFIESEEIVSTTRENSPKSGNRISQVFAYVIVGSIGFYQVPVAAIGVVRGGGCSSSFRSFCVFFLILALTIINSCKMYRT